MTKFWYVTMDLPLDINARVVRREDGRPAVRFEFPHVSQAMSLVRALGNIAKALREGSGGIPCDPPEVDEALLLPLADGTQRGASS